MDTVDALDQPIALTIRMKKSLPDFSKKLVSLCLIGDDYSYAIDRPRWAIQGGRLFLVGTVPRGSSARDWSEGVVRAVAWDRITDYLLFDSADHYRERMRIYERRKEKP